MPLEDYAHWNEDARHIWWQEEGRFEGIEEHERDYDPLDEERQALYYDQMEDDEEKEKEEAEEDSKVSIVQDDSGTFVYVDGRWREVDMSNG